MRIPIERALELLADPKTAAARGLVARELKGEQK